MKLRKIPVAVFLAFLSGLTPVHAATDTLLTVPLKAQEHDQWCWAGASQAVLEYYGVAVDQCTLANWAWGRNDCCGNSTFSWSNTSCNWWNYMWGSYNGHDVLGGSLQGILTNWGVNSDVRSSVLSQTTAVAEINAGRPFVMRFGWTGGGGHFLDGYGYDLNGQYLDYMDPWPGNGYTKSLYTWVVSSATHQWTHTLQITKNPAKLLSVTVSGTGDGTVTSNPQGTNPVGISCMKSSGSCTTMFLYNTSVELTPVPNIISTFDKWASDCTGSGACSVSMNIDKNVTATFVQAPLAKNKTTGVTYATLTGALAAVAINDELLMLGTQYDGAVSLNNATILNGGWNATYQGKSSQPSTLNGNLTILKGDSIAETVVVKGLLSVQGGSLRVNDVKLQQ